MTEKELQVLKENCGEMIMKYSDFRSCMTSFVEKYQVRRALGEIISGAVNGEICSRMINVSEQLECILNVIYSQMSDFETFSRSDNQTAASPFMN